MKFTQKASAIIALILLISCGGNDDPPIPPPSPESGVFKLVMTVTDGHENFTYSGAVVSFPITNVTYVNIGAQISTADFDFEPDDTVHTFTTRDDATGIGITVGRSTRGVSTDQNFSYKIDFYFNEEKVHTFTDSDTTRGATRSIGYTLSDGFYELTPDGN